MSIMMGDLRAALVEAGATPAAADKAAMEVATFKGLKADIALLKWMVRGLYLIILTFGIPGGYLLARVALKMGAAR